MKAPYLFFWLVLPLIVGAAEQSEFRTFKSPDGREMEARLTLVSKNDVFIERRDGLATKVDISIFSKDDQAFIRDWGRKQALKEGGIEVRFKSNLSERSGFEDNGGGIMRKTWKEGYELIVSNNTYKDIKDLRIEYLIFKYEDTMAAQKRNAGDLKRLKGKTTLPLVKSRSDASAQTEQLPMLETKLAPGYVWADRGKKTSEDQLEGIWVRIYVDDNLIYEVSKPENMSRTEIW